MAQAETRLAAFRVDGLQVEESWPAPVCHIATEKHDRRFRNVKKRKNAPLLHQACLGHSISISVEPMTSN